jgi:hypothetical protein
VLQELLCSSQNLAPRDFLMQEGAVDPYLRPHRVMSA